MELLHVIEQNVMQITYDFKKMDIADWNFQ